MTEPQVPGADIPGDELRQAQDLLKRHGTAVGTALLVAAIILGGSLWIRKSRARAAQRASVMYSAAKSVQDLENLLGRYPRSKVAPLALFRLGKMHFDAGSYDMALEQYDAFLQKHGEHLMAPAAEMGRLHCLEARGQYQEAMEGYTRFARERATHFRVPMAVLGRARCAEQLGRPEEARTLYEDFMAQDADGKWTGTLEPLVEGLKRRIENARRQATGSLVPTSPPSL